MKKIILSRWKNFAKKFQMRTNSRLRQSNILSFKIYLRFLSLAYFIGFIFHLADILDLRFIYSKMDRTWQIWTVYLTIMDLAAAIGLWRQKRWGRRLFLIVVSSQLVIYLVFINKFGRQDFLVGFHLVTIIIYIFHSWRTTILIKHIYKKLLDKIRTEANKVEIWTDGSLPLDSKYQYRRTLSSNGYKRPHIVIFRKDKRDQLSTDKQFNEFFNDCTNYLEELILIAHEFGHHFSADYEIDSLYDKIRINGNRATQEEKQRILYEENFAWDKAEALLKELNFSNWSTFNEYKIESLLSYQNNIQEI